MELNNSKLDKRKGKDATKEKGQLPVTVSEGSCLDKQPEVPLDETDNSKDVSCMNVSQMPDRSTHPECVLESTTEKKKRRVALHKSAPSPIIDAEGILLIKDAEVALDQINENVSNNGASNMVLKTTNASSIELTLEASDSKKKKKKKKEKIALETNCPSPITNAEDIQSYEKAEGIDNTGENKIDDGASRIDLQRTAGTCLESAAESNDLTQKSTRKKNGIAKTIASSSVIASEDGCSSKNAKISPDKMNGASTTDLKTTGASYCDSEVDASDLKKRRKKNLLKPDAPSPFADTEAILLDKNAEVGSDKINSMISDTALRATDAASPQSAVEPISSKKKKKKTSEANDSSDMILTEASCLDKDTEVAPDKMNQGASRVDLQSKDMSCSESVHLADSGNKKKKKKISLDTNAEDRCLDIKTKFDLEALSYKKNKSGTNTVEFPERFAEPTGSKRKKKNKNSPEKHALSFSVDTGGSCLDEKEAVSDKINKKKTKNEALELDLQTKDEVCLESVEESTGLKKKKKRKKVMEHENLPHLNETEHKYRSQCRKREDHCQDSENYSTELPKQELEKSLIGGPSNDNYEPLEDAPEKPKLKYKYSKREHGKKQRDQGDVCENKSNKVSKSPEKSELKYNYSKREHGKKQRDHGDVCEDGLNKVSKSPEKSKLKYKYSTELPKQELDVSLIGGPSKDNYEPLECVREKPKLKYKYSNDNYEPLEYVPEKTKLKCKYSNDNYEPLEYVPEKPKLKYKYSNDNYEPLEYVPEKPKLKCKYSNDNYEPLEYVPEKPKLKYKYSKREHGIKQRDHGDVCEDKLNKVSTSHPGVIDSSQAQFSISNVEHHVSSSGNVFEEAAMPEKPEIQSLALPVNDVRIASILVELSGTADFSTDVIKVDAGNEQLLAVSDPISLTYLKKGEGASMLDGPIPGEKPVGDEGEVIGSFQQYSPKEHCSVEGTVAVVSPIEVCKSLDSNNEVDDAKLDIISEQDGPSETDIIKVERPLIPSRKKLLVLDLNGLLVDILFLPHVTDRAYKRIAGKLAFKRPFCDEFMDFCFEAFDIGVWSSRMRYNVDAVVDYVLGNDKKHKLLFSWDQSQCTKTAYKTIENRHKPLVLKELKKLWDKEEKNLPWEEGVYSPSNTLLIDDSPYKALCNPPYTAIFPQPYAYDNENDNSLAAGGDIRTYLEGLAKADNVQEYVQAHPFGQRSISEDHPSWEFYARVIQQVKGLPNLAQT